jgi:hypothetical protein
VGENARPPAEVELKPTAQHTLRDSEAQSVR